MFFQVCERNRCWFPTSLNQWCPFLTNFSQLFPPSLKAVPRPSNSGVCPETLGMLTAPEELQVSAQSQVSLAEGALAPWAQTRAAPQELHLLCGTLKWFFWRLGRRVGTCWLNVTLPGRKRSSMTHVGAAPLGPLTFKHRPPTCFLAPMSHRMTPLSAQTGNDRFAICVHTELVR